MKPAVTDAKEIERQLEETRQRLALVASVANAVLTRDPLNRQLINLVCLTRGFLGCDACVIRTLEGTDLVLAAHAGIPDNLLTPRLPATLGLAAEIFETHKSLACEDVPMSEIARRMGTALKDVYQFRSYAGAPMLVDGRVIGILGIYWETESQRVSETDLEHLQTIANYAAIAVQNAKLTERAEQDREERLRVELALSQAEQIYRDVISALGGVPYRRRFDAERYEYLGESIEELTGYTREELSQSLFASRVREMTPLGEGAELPNEERREQARRGEIKQWRADYCFEKKDGTLVWLSDACVPWFDRIGNAVGTLGILRDVSLRKRTELILRDREKRLSTILDSIPESVIALSAEGIINDISAGAVELLRAPSSDTVSGQPFINFLAEEEHERLIQYFASVHDNTTDPIILTVITTTGEARVAEFQGVPLHDNAGSGQGVLLVGRDITEEHELELQRRQSQRMEAVGLLAGGVAHDFNNILTGILGLSELTLGSVELPAVIASDVREIRRLGERGADLTRQLLAFSRQSISNPTIINLNDVVNDTLKLLRTLLGEHIELRLELSDELRHINAEPAQIEQVIMNLAVNSRDAMPSGGTLTITTRTIDPREETVRRRLGAPADCYAMLAVRDTGEGMTEDVRERIFEPFFTTKQPGRGTGFGLATVYGIVKQSGGEIFVTSQLGEGTIFQITIPCVPKEQTPQARPTSQPGTLLDGTETILVVEDEKSVRDLIVRVCRSRGYTVWEACNGLEALDVFAAVGGKVDLVLSDVIMPQMGGADLAQHIRSLRPTVKFLFISGYTDTDFTLPESVTARTGFIQKPFKPAQLSATIRQILDSQE